MKGVDGEWVDCGIDRPSAYKALIEILFAIIAPLLLLLLASLGFAQAESQICIVDSQLCKMSNTEQTFIMIKPDGVARGLVGEVIKRFEQKVGSIWTALWQECRPLGSRARITMLQLVPINAKMFCVMTNPPNCR